MVFSNETMVRQTSYAGAGREIMINRTEVEELARALARQHGRRWHTMPARIAGLDPNGGREAWLKRADTVLKAVDKAMTLEIQRAIAAISKSAEPNIAEPPSRSRRLHVPTE